MCYFSVTMINYHDPKTFFLKNKGFILLTTPGVIQSITMRKPWQQEYEASLTVREQSEDTLFVLWRQREKT